MKDTEMKSVYLKHPINIVKAKEALEKLIKRYGPDIEVIFNYGYGQINVVPCEPGTAKKRGLTPRQDG
jgi:PHP family Zn ribbon phosphoesterase